MNNFGKSLSTLRKKKGLSQSLVAEKLEVTSDSYKQMEYRSGNPRLETIIKLLQILEASIEELFPELSNKVGALSPNEKELIAKYSSLNEEQQNAILTLIKTFV